MTRKFSLAAARAIIITAVIAGVFAIALGSGHTQTNARATVTVRRTETPAAVTQQFALDLTPAQIIEELQQNGLVPSGGRLVFEISHAYHDTRQFNFHPIAQERRVQDFVLGFTARLDIGAPESMCGMYFRKNDSSVSYALVSEDGKVFLAQANEDGLQNASVLEPSPAVNPGIGATNHVVVIALEDRMILYVNGEMVAEGTFTTQSGTLGSKVYGPEDDFGNTQRATCVLEIDLVVGVLIEKTIQVQIT